MKRRAATTLLITCMLATGFEAWAQSTVALQIRPALFKGKWQLVQTFSMGALHQVKKEDYDCIICFRSNHCYYEEVKYESSHWIIEGNWRVNTKRGMLELTQRHYTAGKLEDHPKDVILDIIQLDPKTWVGGKTDKGQPVKIYYSRISKH